MLDGIKEVVVQYAEVISQITGVQVEIISRDFILMAGTHHISVGSNVRPLSGIAAKTMALKEPQTIEYPRIDPRCADCDSKEFCRETMEITHPILHGNEPLGVITLFSLNEDERGILVKNLIIFQRFIAHIADLISAKAAEFQQDLMNQLYSATIMQIIDHIDRGVIILNPDSTIKSINASAHKHLGLTDSCIGKVMHWEYTGDSMLGEQEYAFTVEGKKYIVVGNHYPVHSNTAFATSVFIFQENSQLRSTLYSLTRKTGQHMLDEIIGSSQATLSLKRNIANLANSASTVLITGESGTGKELVAKAVWKAGLRKDEAFIAINCAAIPEALLECELFGYVKGAFTGADPNGRIGVFELAHNGVVFLDEIGDMPLYLQPKLLRVLQEKHFTRVGSNNKIEVDVRVIAATNKNLQDLIAEKQFREDLFYRLNVIPVSVLPLRQRSADIMDLAESFIKRYSDRLGKKIRRLDDAARQLLLTYSWPGNVRELENTIEYMVNMMDDDGILSKGTLPHSVAGQSAETRLPANIVSAIDSTAFPDRNTVAVRTIRDLEKQEIVKALKLYGKTTKGKLKAAEALGIGIATLYKKIELYNLSAVS